MKFSLQEKLALLMTSAGSQRNAAALVGVTHQKMGRWLKEGEPGGVRAIPDDEATRAAIDNAFAMHVQVSREQAKRDGVPFMPQAPVYVERRQLKQPGPRGEPQLGDRVFSGPTQHIHQRLRKQWVESVVRTEKFYKVNVRSKVDLRAYTTRMVEGEPQYRRIKRAPTKLQISRFREDVDKSLRDFVAKEGREKGRIVDRTEPFPLYTRSLPTTPGYKAADIANELERLLNEKHAPAAVGKGTQFASEYLLQLFPADYAAALIRQGHRAPAKAPSKKPRRR